MEGVGCRESGTSATNRTSHRSKHLMRMRVVSGFRFTDSKGGARRETLADVFVDDSSPSSFMDEV
jgi:hypothetical protein